MGMGMIDFFTLHGRYDVACISVHWVFIPFHGIKPLYLGITMGDWRVIIINQDGWGCYIDV